MRSNDPRTDNWAGRRDPGSEPNNFRFPRSAKEAGFHYVPKSQQEKDLSVWVVTVIIALIFIGAVILENLYWVA